MQKIVIKFKPKKEKKSGLILKIVNFFLEIHLALYLKFFVQEDKTYLILEDNVLPK